MSTTITDKPDKKRIEIGKVIHRCNALCDEVNMIFFLPSQKYESIFRYTASNPATILEFLVITWSNESADKFQRDWIIENARKDDFPDFTINLLILSEREFLSEYETQEDFRELIETAVVVYDADAEFVLKLGGAEDGKMKM